jgi:hypothetical protein
MSDSPKSTNSSSAACYIVCGDEEALVVAG